MSDQYAGGESFTVQGPPMVWDTSAGTFIVNEDQAEVEGWRAEVLPTGTVRWVKDFSPTTERES
jgi:hypothetical protein